MMAVVKSGDKRSQSASRYFGGVPPQASPESPPEIVELRETCAALEQALAEAETQAEAARTERDEAFDRGRTEGCNEAETRESERLEALTTGIETAVKSFQESLGSTEKPAMLLARTCLDKLFGTKDSRDAIVADMLARKLQSIADQTVVRVDVAATDFADDDTLAKLVAGMDNPAVNIRRDPKLDSGACLIGFEVGGIDVGIDRQWAALRHLFDEALA